MIKEYIRLMKPGIIFGNLITALGGFFLAKNGQLDFKLLSFMILGLSSVIASGCVFNNICDKTIDEKMQRTKNRPIVTGSISKNHAKIFGVCLLLSGICFLYLVNLITLFVSLFGFIVYVFFYTPLKKVSVHATLVGSLAGAIPPVVGYCSVSNRIDELSIFLFVILVFWQMPHFYAIAMYRLSDYKEANIPILPSVKGLKVAKMHMIFYSLGFAFSVLLPSVFGYMNYANMLLSSVLGASWLIYAVLGLKANCDIKWAKNMFRLSILIVTALSISWSLQ